MECRPFSSRSEAQRQEPVAPSQGRQQKQPQSRDRSWLASHRTALPRELITRSNPEKRRTFLARLRLASGLPPNSGSLAARGPRLVSQSRSLSSATKMAPRPLLVRASASLGVFVPDQGRGRFCRFTPRPWSSRPHGRHGRSRERRNEKSVFLRSSSRAGGRLFQTITRLGGTGSCSRSKGGFDSPC